MTKVIHLKNDNVTQYLVRLVLFTRYENLDVEYCSN